MVTAATAAASAAAGPRPAAADAAAAAYTPIGTCEQVVHHPSPSVDHPMHRSVISLHPDGTVIDSSPHGVSPGRWRPVSRSSFELIIDEYQYDDVDLTLQVVPHCTATFVDANRWTGTCTAALTSPTGSRARAGQHRRGRPAAVPDRLLTAAVGVE